MADFGVQDTFGLTTPTGGYTNESSEDESLEIATVQDELGVTVVAKAKKLLTKSVSIKGKGDANLAGVTAGPFTAGTVKVLSAKQDETNGEFPDFEISGKAYDTLT